MSTTSSNQPDDARITKIGKLGESAFSTLATQADFVVNGSEQDEAGWDFLIEPLPGAASPTIAPEPVHTEAFSFRARVQVKATDRSEGFVTVKLSNWLRMVEDPLPCFFFVLEFNGKDVPQDMYLIHVGEDLIRRVLKRSHENAVGEAKALNHLTMRLSYGEQHLLSPADGATLQDRLLTGMAEGSDSWAGYAEWKGRLVHTAGFEGGNVQIRVAVPVDGEPPDPVTLLSDLETGAVSSIEVAQAEFFRTRFGIVDSNPFETRGPSLLQVASQRPDTFVNLEIRAAGTTARQRVVASLRAPSGLGPALKAGVDLSAFKPRILTPHLDIVADLQNRDGTFQSSTPEKDETIKARTVKLHAELAAVVSTAIKRDTEVELEVTHGSDTIMQFSVTGDQLQAFGDVGTTAEVLGRYVRLCTQFDVIDEASISLGEIEERQDAMRQFAAYADDANGLADFAFTLIPNEEGRERAAEYEGQRVIALSPWGVTLGSHTFVVVLAAWGTLETVEKRNDAIDYRIVGDPILRVARLAHPGPIGDIPLWQLITDAAHRAKEREETGRFIVLGVEPTGSGALALPAELTDAGEPT